MAVRFLYEARPATQMMAATRSKVLRHSLVKKL